MSFSDLNSSIIDSLALNCPNLKKLILVRSGNLRNSKFSLFKNLKELDLSWSSITDTDINKMDKLESLSVMECGIGYLSGISSTMKKLDLRKTYIEDTDGMFAR